MSIHLPGSEAILQRSLGEILDRAGRQGLDAAGVGKALGDRWSEGELRAGLEALQEAGTVVEWNRRWLAVRFTDWRVGRLQLLDGGDGLVRTGEAGEAGYFVRGRDLGRARDGDQVLVKPAREGRRRRQTDLPRATVSKVLRRGSRTVVGTLELDERGRWLAPFDSRAGLDVLVEGEDELPENVYVVVAVDERSAPFGGAWRGRVTEVLGEAEVPGTDTLVVLRHLEIPDEFPPGVLAAATGLPADPEPDDWQGREDLRERVLVTIDGESARDFDDAIGVEALDGGRYRLGVHIADVSHYVEEGGVLDLEAYRRGTSVYFPERAVPMLPEALSNGLCSLRPEVPRLALSAFLEISPEGRVLRRRFAPTVIRSRRRLTYDGVRRLLEEPRPGDAADYGAVLPMLRVARALMQILLRARLERGSIDFDLPQGDVVLDTDGITVGVRPGERHVAHRIIEEFMIAANEAVALELDGHEVPAVYRVHGRPSGDDLAELKEILRSLGLTLKGDLRDLHPRALQEVLQRVEGRPEEPFVSSLVLRSMQRAVYEPECRGHYALSARHYTHFTSPIRRYPDLLVHRQLKSLLAGGDPQAWERTLLAERLPAIADHSSVTERRAEQAERTVLQWKLVRWLAGRVGSQFTGRVTGVHPFGLFVQLVDYYVDGLVPIRNLSDDFYVYEKESHRLVGQERGRVFRLADEVQVVLTGVDLRLRGLNLRMADLPQPPPARRRREGRPGRRRRRSVG